MGGGRYSLKNSFQEPDSSLPLGLTLLQSRKFIPRETFIYIYAGIDVKWGQRKIKIYFYSRIYWVSSWGPISSNVGMEEWREELFKLASSCPIPVVSALWGLQKQTQAENHFTHHTHKPNNFWVTCVNCISFILCSFAFLESCVDKHLLTYCQFFSCFITLIFRLYRDCT